MGRWLKQKPSIVHEGIELPYELVRRPRVTRNVYLELADDGQLRVVAPKRMSGRAVHRSLQNRSWAVVQFLSKQREHRRDTPELRYISGEHHLYLGCWYPLDICPGRPGRSEVKFDGEKILVTTRKQAPHVVPEILRWWYRQRALEHFSERLDHFCKAAPWTGGKVAPLALRRMKRTMGSCSRSGKITINPHLVKAPTFLSDYVVAHEVCHLEEHNHGKGFYALLNQLFPDWREAKMRLKAKWDTYRAD